MHVSNVVGCGHVEHLIKVGADVGVPERVEDRVQFRVDVAEPREHIKMWKC
jgi:hypothetical protein